MGFQKLDFAGLAITGQTRECVINAGLFADCGSQALVGAGQHDDADLLPLQFVQGSDGILWDLIIKGDNAPAIFAVGDEDGELTTQ